MLTLFISMIGAAIGGAIGHFGFPEIPNSVAIGIVVGAIVGAIIRFFPDGLEILADIAD